ncbi:hypothetical protein NP233_g4216 [Leucocoprinus birnbaumii]|uniref:Uncharacterized protein n=1 Tax=Leucocoprinus birnbaumii TaxID=56174 RepID=A0AAD5VV36_9AGAR|nr:hypothetical protein NP233_g4216 [Leucocoprinus birnbaumii]
MDLSPTTSNGDSDVRNSPGKDGVLAFDGARLLRGLKWGLGLSNGSDLGNDDEVMTQGENRGELVGDNSEFALNIKPPDSTGRFPPQYPDSESLGRGPPSSLSSLPPPPYTNHALHAAPELPHVLRDSSNGSSLQLHDGLSAAAGPQNGEASALSAPQLIQEMRIRGSSLHSPSRYPHPKCHPDTRREFLHTLENLLSLPERSKAVYLLFGPAGSGKSAVVQTFAEICDKAGRLAAAVFFSRTKSRYDASRVMATIAHQLAAQSALYRAIVCKVIEEDPQVFTSLSTQYEKLVYRPALEANLLDNDKSLIIILDGLDECSDRHMQTELIELITRVTPTHHKSSSHPKSPSFLWLISTRPEPHIKDLVARRKPSVMCGNLSLDDHQSVKDVRQVLVSGFRDIRERFSTMFGTEAWPSEDQLERLSNVASGFFMAAFSILAFVGDAQRKDPKAQLAKCLEFFDCVPFHPNIYLATVANPFHDLDTLYMLILADVESHSLPMTISVLRLCADNGTNRSIHTPQRIVDILGIGHAAFYDALQSLHSVLDVPSPDCFDTGYPRFYHSSFPDFLRDATRSGPFTISELQSAKQLHIVGKKPVGDTISDIVFSPRSVIFYSSPEGSEASDDDGISLFIQGAEQEFSEVETDNDLETYRRLPNPLTVIPLTEKLASVLQKSKSRKALRSLQGEEAQLMVDFLYNVVRESSCPIPWLQKHALIALYKLSKTTLLYPHCYVLKDIVFDSHESGGAFSDIHRGHHGERQLCLKVIRLHQKSDTDAMLKIYAKEAILWGQLRHPNIVPFYGIYYLNDARRQVCLVSPWMHHGNLVEYLKRNPLAPRTPFFHDVAAGLCYMHTRGLIHSDLKGLNVLVDDSGHACITDFGLSFIRTDQTLAYTIAATTVHGFSYHWAAPELLDDGGRATTASDVWALGCVYYEILTGKLPYHGLSDAQIIRRLDRGILPDRPQLSQVGEAESIVWKIIDRVWVMDPEQRPRCQEILQELEWAGLSRPLEDISQQENGRDGRRSFEEAMKHGKEMVVDLMVVGRALDHLAQQNQQT